MQGGQGPGYGVYLARRIVGVLVILVLLVLLVPRACQAFLGPEEEPSSEAPETSATDEEIAGDAEGVPADLEVDNEVSPDEIARSEDVDGDEEGDTQQDLEDTAGLAGLPTSLEAPLDQGAIVSAANHAAPVPHIDASQQAVQPLPFAEPILPAEPVVFVEPILPAEPTVSAEPILPTELIPLEEPIFFEQAAFFEGPIFSEEATFFEVGSVLEGASNDAMALAPGPDAGDLVDTGGAVAVAGSVSAASGQPACC